MEGSKRNGIMQEKSNIWTICDTPFLHQFLVRNCDGCQFIFSILFLVINPQRDMFVSSILLLTPFFGKNWSRLQPFKCITFGEIKFFRGGKFKWDKSAAISTFFFPWCISRWFFFLFLLNYSTLRIKNVKNNGKIFQCWRETKLKENKQNILSPSTPTNKMTALIFRWNCCCP